MVIYAKISDFLRNGVCCPFQERRWEKMAITWGGSVHSDKSSVQHQGHETFRQVLNCSNNNNYWDFWMQRPSATSRPYQRIFISMQYKQFFRHRSYTRSPIPRRWGCLRDRAGMSFEPTTRIKNTLITSLGNVAILIKGKLAPRI